MRYQMFEVLIERKGKMVPRGRVQPDKESTLAVLDDFPRPAISVDLSPPSRPMYGDVGLSRVVGVNSFLPPSLLGEQMSDVCNIVTEWKSTVGDGQGDPAAAGSSWATFGDATNDVGDASSPVPDFGEANQMPRTLVDAAEQQLAGWAAFLGRLILVLTAIGTVLLLIAVLRAEVTSCYTDFFGEVQCSDFPDPNRSQNVGYVIGAALLEAATGTLLLVGAALLRRRPS